MQNTVDGILREDFNLTNLIKQSPVIMALLKGENHKIQLINENGLEFLGREWNLIKDQPLFEAIPELRGQGFEQILKDVYSSGIPYHMHEVMLKVPGLYGKEGTKYLNITFQALRNKDHKVIGIVATGVDITEQVLPKMSERQQSNEDMQQFAHIASHDLKEPVRKITTYAEMILNEKLPEEVTLNFVRKIHKSGKRMANTIEDILRYSTSDHYLTDEFQDIDLNEIINGIRLDLEMRITEKKAVLNISKLPVITGSRILIYQLFYNLISNALKFSKPCLPVNIKISATTIRSDNKEFIQITVADTGIGFEQQYAEKIFEKFSRLHSKDQYEGTGLGLALCRKIAERHEGTITADGSLDEGAVFTITLPVKRR